MNLPRSSRPGLDRVITFPQAAALVVGTIIGASIFVQPSEVTGQVPSVAGVLLVWGVSGLLTLFGALIIAELASIFSESGGVYLYLRNSISPAFGFLWGWGMLWSMHSGIIAVVAVVFARYFAYFAPLGPWGQKAIAIALILFLSTINYLGVRYGALVQSLFTAGKLVAVFAMVVLGFALGGRVEQHFVVPAGVSEGITPADFSLALVAGLFAFGGWHMVTYNSEETVNPRKTIPRALVAGTLIVTVSYMALNLVYMYVLPLDRIAQSTRVAADAADVLLGSGGGATMSALVVFSTFGALTGIILAGPRVYYAMARDGLLFSYFGAIHERYHTPHRAIVLQGIWASVLVATGTFRVLFTRVVYTEWFFFGVMAAGLFVLRRRGAERGYSVWGYPVMPLVFMASCFAIVIYQIITDTANSLEGLLILGAGVPVYYIWLGRRRSTTS